MPDLRSRKQISNLERELGTQLLVRDRRHVELTPAGIQFLSDAREVLDAATRAFDRAREGGGELPLRLGYVSWLPPEAAAIPDPRIRIDEWVLPSHTQAERVAEGSLDLAIAWIEEADIERLNLSAHLLWYEKLEAVMPRAHDGDSSRERAGDRDHRAHRRRRSIVEVMEPLRRLPSPRRTRRL